MNLIKSELRKFYRPKFLIALFSVLLFLQAGFTYALFANAKKNNNLEILATAGALFSSKTIGVFLGIICFCITCANFAQEFTFGTIKNLLILEPSRLKFLFGKLAAQGVFINIVVCYVGIFGVGLSFLSAKKSKIDISLWNLFSLSSILVFINLLLASLAYGLIGAILGGLLRSSVLALSIGLVWFLIMETLIGLIDKNYSKWLPGENLANLSQGGMGNLSFSHSGIMVVTYCGIGLGILLIIFGNRDVAN